MNDSIDYGDYVVFIKNGRVSELGRTRKDIWRVDGFIGSDDVKLISLSDPSKRFSTDVDNVISVRRLQANSRFKQEYFNAKAYEMARPAAVPSFATEYEAKFVGDSKKMRSGNKDMVKRTVDSNVSAVKVGATIATGRTVNAVAMSKIRKQLPMLVRAYADTPLGAVVLANIVDFGVKQFAADNAKFRYVSDAMMQAAMVDLLAEFDFEAVFNDILSNVTIGDIDEAQA